ncbi:MAG: exodeoxyribonuclease VII small subunit [Alphaproteobacteria bacterium]
MTASPIPPDIAKLSFEAALEELESIVKKLEAGKGKLDDSIRAYERGAALKRHCEAKLREAQAKVERITLGPDGAVGTEPADTD